MDFITSTLSPQLLQRNASVRLNMFRCVCVCVSEAHWLELHDGTERTSNRMKNKETIILDGKTNSVWKKCECVETERAANQRHETLDYYVVQHKVK